MNITKEQITEQVQADIKEWNKLPVDTQVRLQRIVDELRQPSHINFSDPEVL